MSNIFPKQFKGLGPHSHVNSKQTAVEIFHLISETTVRFLPFITEFSDNHETNWNAEQVYGRMDDLLSFQRTKRTITLAFDCPSESEDEAIDNFKNMSLLKQFVYPSYAQRGNALSLRGGPLFRVKLLNFVNSLDDKGKGVLCAINGINFSPNQDAGFYILNQNIKSPQNRSDVIIPKLFSISLQANVLHEYTPGWVSNKFSKTMYPYDLQSPLAKVNEKGTNAGLAENKADRPIDIAGVKKILISTKK